MFGIAEALGIELVDVLGAGRPRREPAIIGLDLDAAERLAVAGRFGVHDADRIAGELGQFQLLRRQRLQRGLLWRARRDVDPLIDRRTQLRRQLLVELARIAAAPGHDLGREQAEDEAVLVSGPDRAVALEE